MTKANALNSEKFNMLLQWLGPTPESAGEKYEQIRRGLIQIFLWHGATDAEDLADETINRVANNFLISWILIKVTPSTGYPV
jgi:hypothetical protein